jgi:alpha-tubulin suppressor-like RCC1 family protein
VRFGAVAIVFTAVAWLSGCVADPPPGIGTAVAEDGRATVTWSPPPGDTAETVTAYVVTPYIGSEPQTPSTFGPDQLSGIVTGLTNGATYSFTVHAINAQGGESARSRPSNAATPQPGHAVAVAVGRTHSCALIADGGVRCWGGNDNGYLGNGTTTDSSVPVAVTGITDAVAVDSGSFGSCAVLAAGMVTCWGIFSSVPEPVPGFIDAIGVSVGVTHSCAVRATGRVKCWGHNQSGQLGNGGTGESFTPVNVIGLFDAVQVSAGMSHTCAVRAGGQVQCWGDNSWGQLNSVGITNAVAVSAGQRHSCAVLADGGSSCWGYPDGPTPLVTPNEELEQVPVTDVVDVMANTVLTCAVQSDGDLFCGDSQAENLVVFPMPAYSDVAGVSSHSVINFELGGHFCVVLTAGDLRCQGRNDEGQLGNGTTTNSDDQPVDVVGY